MIILFTLGGNMYEVTKTLLSALHKRNITFNVKMFLTEIVALVNHLNLHLKIYLKTDQKCKYFLREESKIIDKTYN